MSKLSGRYLKPNAGRIALASERFLEFGKMSIGYGLLGAGSAVLFFVALTVAVLIAESWPFFFALLPALITLFPWVILISRSVPLDDSSSHYYYEARYTLMPRIKQAGREAYGEPLLEEIFEHSRLHDRRSRRCQACEERRQVMDRLAPAKFNSTESIDRANMFIELLGETTETPSSWPRPAR